MFDEGYDAFESVPREEDVLGGGRGGREDDLSEVG
jgi:hypothetical protein